MEAETQAPCTHPEDVMLPSSVANSMTGIWATAAATNKILVELRNGMMQLQRDVEQMKLDNEKDRAQRCGVLHAAQMTAKMNAGDGDSCRTIGMRAPKPTLRRLGCSFFRSML